MWSVCSRCSDPATAARIAAGLLSVWAPNCLPSLSLKPNSWQSPTFSRLPLSVGRAAPRWCRDRKPRPYRKSRSRSRSHGALRDGLAFVGWAVRLTHGHTAEPDGPDREAFTAEFAFNQAHIVSRQNRRRRAQPSVDNYTGGCALHITAGTSGESVLWLPSSPRKPGASSF